MADARQLADELDQLVQAAGKPELPKNLGNIPDDAPAETQVSASESPQDDPAPEPVEAEPEAPAVDEPAPQPTNEVAMLRAQLESLQREIQFVRAGAQPTAPQEPELPFQVTEDDVNVILQGGPKAAQYMQNALRAVAIATQQATEQRLVNAYQQQQTVQASSTNLRQQFYGQHPELEPYYEIVGAQAQATAQRMPWADAKVLMEETARATREELRRRGIPVVASAKSQGKRAKLRPASAESGSGRTNGATKLSPIERDIFQMMGARG